MSLSQILAVLRARWLAMLAVFLLVVVSVFLLCMVLPKKYSASAAVMVDVKSPDPVAGMVLPAMMSTSYMTTQVDLLMSERVALKAMRGLGLHESPVLRQQWQAATKGAGSFDAWVSDYIRRGLEVKPSRESNILTVNYVGAEPNFSAALCNAFVQAFIAVTVEMRQEPAREYNTMFDGLADQLRGRLEKAQTRLSNFLREKELMATDERMDVENARLADLSAQYTQLQAGLIDMNARRSQAVGRVDQTPDVLSNSVVSGLRADLARLESKLEESQARLGDNHPNIIELRANIATMRKRMTEEASRVNGSLNMMTSVSESRVSQLHRSLEEQRTKVLRLKGLRDEASVMTRDVENLQRAYDAVQGRATQARIESQTSQTNLSVVKTATPPTDASSPKTVLNMLMAIVGGTILAFLTALLLELADRRVRTVDDVLTDLKLPLVGVMLKSADERSLLMGRKIQPWLMRRSMSTDLAV
jgi:succinoglycan biosynthesis transport protein ExoP